MLHVVLLRTFISAVRRLMPRELSSKRSMNEVTKKKMSDLHCEIITGQFEMFDL